MAAFAIALLWSGGAAWGQVPQQSIHPSKTGQNLVNALQNDYTPSQTLGYDVARDSLYRHLDTRDGVLIGRYGGYTVDIGPNEDPSVAAYENGAGLSAEHTWPQSKGAGSEPAKSDLHNIFPVKQTINSARSNHPFAEVPDSDTDTWYRKSNSQSSVPASNIDEYSELDGSDGSAGPRFEVREDHEGNAARAVYYFYVIYQSQATDSFFDTQKSTLLQWHDSDPIDQNEYDLSQWIKSKQGTANPFVLDTTLVRRAFETAADVPTVQFATSSQTVGEEDGTATLTAELNNPDGNAVDVDVVFDDASSSASGSDIGNYSAQTVSFPSSASDGATQSISVSLTDDSEPEGTEEAIFALQNVQTSGDAQVGSNSTTALTITDNDNPLVVNEVLADPAPGSDGDANQDGTRSATDDEFVEIYNTSTTASVDLSGYEYVDEGVGVRHVFPGGTTVAPEASIVVFGGGNPADQIPGVVQTASTGTLALNNGGDTFTITDAGGEGVLSFSYDGNVDDQSMTRDPDFTGSFVAHSSASGSGGTLFSPGRTVEGDPLPVELVSFEAQWSGANATILTWRTASETDNAGFEVQRRMGVDGSWKVLQFIEGTGTASETQHYRYPDENLPYGADRVTYRLRQVDIDGTESFTEPITIGRNAVSELQLQGSFPNPTSGPTTVRYAVPAGMSGRVHLEVFDLLGRRIKTLKTPTGQSGSQEIQLDASGFPSGTYFLRLTAGGQTRSTSMTVTR